MTTFLYLDKSIPKESGANNKVIRCGAAWMPDNLEMALIKEYSKYVKLTATDPTVCKNLLEKSFIGDIPFLIPTDRTISTFLYSGIEDGAYIEDGGIFYSDTSKENLLSFIVEIVQKNIWHILSNQDLAHNILLTCKNYLPQKLITCKISFFIKFSLFMFFIIFIYTKYKNLIISATYCYCLLLISCKTCLI